MSATRNLVMVGAALALSALSQPSAAQSCPNSMRYLEAKLPKYPVAELEKIHESIVSDNAKDVFEAIRKSGSVSEQAAQMVSAARKIEDALPLNAECFRPHSSNPAAAVRDVIEGRWKFASRSFDDLSFKDMCAFQVSIQYYGMVATREMATALACMANAR
jgi:hypothetical protein